MTKFATLPTTLDGEVMHVNPAHVTYVRERKAQSGCRVFFDKEHSFGVKLDAEDVVARLIAALDGQS
ncbi:MAG: hypothetical protein AAFV45_16190 [Pseudomonadota bacterium]